jgi:rod shape-determining protein MreC
LKRSRPSARALAITLRPLLTGAGVILLIAASLSLIVMSRTQTGFPRNLRAAISDTVVPVVSVLARPVDAFSAAGHWLSDMMTLREDNVRLKSDNARLQQWQAVATDLSFENEKLRALLKFAPPTRQAYTSARVATDTGSPYSRSVIITSGANLGVQEDLAVINEAGLVGRVADVSSKTARVLLLTDINSRIPVISEDSRERAIAGGNNSELLSLIYLPENSKLKVGEKIITSGDGGVLPPGLPVGVVTKIEKGAATVKPFVDGYRLDYVSVVDFSM